jgi:hypothetical protein
MEVNDLNSGNNLILQDINKSLNSLGLSSLSSDTLSQVTDLENSSMNKQALNQLYNNLSTLLGKSKNTGL